MSNIGENRSLGILDSGEWANICEPRDKMRIPVFIMASECIPVNNIL